VFNPLDLPGPDFLVFYACVALLVLVALYVVRSSVEGGPARRLDTSDPYLIAYLRGGTFETLRVATVALVDRGLLKVNEDEATIKRKVKAQNLRLPLEQALVDFFERERPAKDIFDDLELRAACEEYERRLSTLGLLPDDEVRAARRRRLMYALVVLIGLGALKLLVALSRGRTNVLFLVVLTVVCSIAAVKLARPFRTTRGNTMLADLRRLFARLKDRGERIRLGKGDADAVLLAAVFGLAALPKPAFAFAHKLYPRTSSGSGDGCGSSCGSGCGGGGCGGGCGGCGGGGGD